jgi:hypothetical protein
LKELDRQKEIYKFKKLRLKERFREENAELRCRVEELMREVENLKNSNN